MKMNWLLCGAAMLLSPVLGITPFVGTLHAQAVDDPITQVDDEPDDQDDDVTNDDQVEAEPDTAVEAQWSDAPEDTNEVKAEQVDADDYIQKCQDKRVCQATLDYVNQQLSATLKGYGSHSTRRNKEKGPSRTRPLTGATNYRVLQGQQLELVSRRAGPNDPFLWSEVTRVVPRPQSDRLMGSFQVYRKRKDDLLAFVQGEQDSDKFLMAINEPNHLGTDLREQYLTVVHEFMHMIVLNQFVGDQVYDQNPNGKGVTLGNVANILKSVFGADSPTTQRAADTEQQPSDDTAETETAVACTGVADDGGCYPEGTIFNAFVRRFWSKSDLQHNKDDDFYDKNESRFVTQYATTSPHEDISESFSYWVIAEGKGKTVADAKQRFFGRYPQFVALKEHIRRAVIAEILKSQPKASNS